MNVILRACITKEEWPILKMSNTYIKTKLEYYYIVWSPLRQKQIYKVEKVHKNV